MTAWRRQHLPCLLYPAIRKPAESRECLTQRPEPCQLLQEEKRCRGHFSPDVQHLKVLACRTTNIKDPWNTLNTGWELKLELGAATVPPA